jgi:anti-anti-sigma factor
MFEFKIDNLNRTISCVFEGRLLIENPDETIKKIVDKVQALNSDFDSEFSVVIDLAKVDFISSSFLRICVAVAKFVGPEKNSVINVSSHVMKIFSVSGLVSVLNVKQ